MITVKQNDTGLGIKATLKNEHGPINLIGKTTTFFIKDLGMIVEGNEIGEVVVPIDLAITNTPGIFEAEFEVRYPDGRVETYPNDGYLQIKVLKRIGG